MLVSKEEEDQFMESLQCDAQEGDVVTVDRLSLKDLVFYRTSEDEDFRTGTIVVLMEIGDKVVVTVIDDETGALSGDIDTAGGDLVRFIAR